MSITYRDAIARLYGLHKLGMKFGLHNTRVLCRLMGDPQLKFKSVHVAGTNGKGSTASMLTAIATAAGLRCGLTTSPHLLDLTERIRIGETPVSHREMARLTERLFDRVAAHNRKWPGKPLIPTFFEAMIVLAFSYFADQKVDLAVIEVGLGGRLDSTNVIKPELSIITSIGLEHTEFLGPTIVHIAREKSGIIKKGAPVISGVTQSEAQAVVEQTALSVSQSVWQVGRDIKLTASGANSRIVINDFSVSVRAALEGAHQRRNAAMAACAAYLLMQRGFAITKRDVKTGIENTRWPGRLQWVQADPPWLMDAAHNAHAMETLVDYLRKRTSGKRILCVFGVMKDKDYQPMLKLLSPLVDTWILARPALERAESPKAIAAVLPESAKTRTRNHVSTALALARNMAHDFDLVLVTGSIFLLAEAYRSVVGLGCKKLDSNTKL
jgi:dihydrofolate synthase/folylpolyglutamate synthase